MPLIRKGAEANLYLEDWHDCKVIVKRRVCKRYRLMVLDTKLRSYRTIHEAQIMHEAKRSGVPTPTIYLVDPKEYTIIMEYISGRRLKETLQGSSNEGRDRLCQLVGSQIAMLHQNNIIHGDLTTSNMIPTDNEKIFFIDFGLSYHSIEVEDFGVDLHLMKRALNSTHYLHADKCFGHVLLGYREFAGSRRTEEVVQKVREIQRRGRYFAER
jgi:TP53 regulating kinase-like protein